MLRLLINKIDRLIPVCFLSLSYDVFMKSKEIRKIQFGGWSKRDYKEIREKIKHIDREDFVLSATDKVVLEREGISLSGADRIKML